MERNPPQQPSHAQSRHARISCIAGHKESSSSVESSRNLASGQRRRAARENAPGEGAAGVAGRLGESPAEEGRNRDAETRRLIDYQEVLASERVPPSPRDLTRARLLLFADAASIFGALVITNVASPLGRPGYRLLAVLALWLVSNKLLGLYDWDAVVIDKSTIQELPRLAQSVVIWVVAILIFGPAVGLKVHRYGALEFACIALAAMLATRSLVRSLVWRWYGPERALIVGSGPVADLISRKLKTHPSYQTELVGYVDVAETGGAEGMALLGHLSRMHQLCRDLHIERIIVGFSVLEHEHLLDAIRAGNALGIKVTVVPRLFEVLGSSVVVDDVEGMSMLSLRGLPRTQLALALKRGVDITGAMIGLVLLSPVFLLVALAIKLDSRGPVIFSQVRIGRANKPFRIRKFRTMIEDADRFRAEVIAMSQIEYPLLKVPEDQDPRLTRVGRVLRRSMLDELPQLWNVLRGQMSLVGPRPLEPQDDAVVIGWHRARLELTPGLTGPWQAMGRHEIPFSEMMTLDYLYVANWSLWSDIKLILRTVQLLLRSHRG